MFAPSPRLRSVKNLERSLGQSSPAKASVSGSLTVLGIDPGLTRCGYAVLQVQGNTDISLTSLGVLRTKPEDELPARLAEIAQEVDALLDQYQPTAVVVERIFFQSNVRTAMSVGQVSGLVLSAAARRGIEVVQYSPNQVKLAITGWGGADKAQVQKMVKQRLKLNTIPKPADAADAAAIALCHIASSPLAMKIADSVAAKK